ncbi:condensin subunit Smc [Granulicatella balaenopterae]|uniref:Chromosome partition protein Smc n=1 Tax=Granulicatella balaenopterae TaxID=137733 RepID=A0A1H9PBT4_9LACT|nr:chromosome segregation protein SMC [Granulicatella balaenopterae]SER45666.1 condensin subunit Smc [Granulicatella balaenopterae]
MQLDKIEMSGFKSFADKTVIEFDKGVTAVVGPNGSGKSNLSEAIKWVLGEQSAKSLRGKKMDDIIFAGSQTRKSQNIAEVSLYINNEDKTLAVPHAEVVLTRRLNRKGESNFYINREACRLKDITNLMMDSGLGKDSFALISQGKVEKIFNDKPEDRRSIIEEAAGVLKYKDRKQQAQKKLSQTQDHLNRVEDILHEIYSQLEPLEEQKDQAVKFLELKKQLADVETAVLAVEIEELNQQWSTVKNQVSDVKFELTRLSALDKELEETLTKQYADLEAKNELVDQLQLKYVNLIQRVEQLDGDRKVLMQKRDYFLQSDEENQVSLTEAITEQKALVETIEELTTKKAAKEEEVNTVTLEWKELVDQLATLTKGNEAKLKETQDDYIDTLQNETKLKNQERHLEKLMETNELNKERIEERKDKLEAELDELQKSLNEANEKKEIAEAQIIQIEAQMTGSRAEVLALRTAKDEKSKALNEKERSLQNLEAHYRSLKNVSEDYAGYYQGVKAVLKHKDAISGVIGAVAELINVPEQFATAIEIALGANSQHIIVENETSAAQAIQFLKQRRAGRATFLPITVIKSRQLPANVQYTIEQRQGVVGIASELVEVSEKFQTIIENILGTTIVTENLHQAQQLAKELQYRYRIVTLEGEVVNAGGAMTGGATNANQNQSIVRRNAQLQKITEELELARQSFKTLEEEYEYIEAEWLQKANQSRELDSKEQELKQTIQEVTLSLKYLTEQEQSLTRQHSVQNYEWEQLIEEYQDLENQYIENHQALTKASQHVMDLKAALDVLQLSQEDRTHQIQTKQILLQDASANKATAKEQLLHLERDLQMSIAQKNKQDKQIEILTSKTSEQHQSKEQDEKQLEQLSKDFEKSSRKLEKVKAQLDTEKEIRNQLELDMKQAEVRKNQTLQKLQELYKEQTKLETKANRFEISIDQKLVYLSQEYELTYEAASEKTHLEVSVEEANHLVHNLKQQIEAMGAVNLMAIDEYEKVQERFTFLKEQQDDLIMAKTNLESTIDEMDEEVKQRFKITFNAIKEQFAITFPRLFGGGKATLELTDPSNLLETGIEIIAQPPGKKLQSLSLLSGGERAFTAIALLFAILEVKPVPFCLLDEVEAALDEANVQRYGRYLKEFTTNTQFIVITHRRGTMEEADVLYGVTMQESGVSRLASVKFDDFEELQ